LRIAVAQMQTVPGDVARNRARALELADEALTHDPDIILFHEELLVGYVDNLAELAEAVDGPTTRAFCSLLAGRGAKILYGLTERDGETLYIAGTLVGAEGVLANYHKTHLWWKAPGLRHEPTCYQPGDRLVAFDLQGTGAGYPTRCGIMICYDGDFPELTRAYADRGSDVVFWLNNRESRGHREVRPLAEANSIIIASACCCGMNEQGRDCGGGSNITDHDGTLLTEIWYQEGVICADVDPQAAARARMQNPWFVGRRLDLYGAYTRYKE